MAETVKADASATSPPAGEAIQTPPETAAIPGQIHARALPRAGSLDAEKLVGNLLRMGAIGSGAMFAGSLVLGAVTTSETAAIAADYLRKIGGSVLLVTPIVRLIVGGTVLGLKGEYRYALYAGGILFLLAIALGTGVHV